LKKGSSSEEPFLFCLTREGKFFCFGCARNGARNFLKKVSPPLQKLLKRVVKNKGYKFIMRGTGFCRGGASKAPPPTDLINFDYKINFAKTLFALSPSTITWSQLRFATA
jgi:hypothetical protein